MPTGGHNGIFNGFGSASDTKIIIIIIIIMVKQRLGRQSTGDEY